jgi:hypothetical protein
MIDCAMRRRDLLLSLSSAALWAPHAFGQSVATPALRLQLDSDRVIGTIPDGFTGLSYESAVLSDPSFFNGDNTDLVAFFRRLGGAGVLRLGGNTSEYGVWTPQRPGAAPDVAPALGPDTGRKTPARRAITPEAIRNLRGFIDATGWSLIYGLNLGTASEESIALEARAVMDAMGRKLVAFQIGNEPDLFHKNGLRPPAYGFDQYTEEWLRTAAAVRASVPGAVFAGPDIAGHAAWLEGFARRFGGNVRFLSDHYYAEGPPDDPAMTVAYLLSPGNRRLAYLLEGIKQARTLAPQTPFRLTETNSCYNGGKPGVSNTFASALWGAELMAELAAAGVEGVNFHGGGRGPYTPISGSRADGFAARPLYYGMLLFTEAGSGALVACAFDGSGSAPPMSAFAVKHASGTLSVLLFNKGDTDSVLSIDAGRPMRVERVLRLTAPSLDATDGVTLGGASIGANAAWSPGLADLHATHAEKIALPAASAALIGLRVS